MHLTSTINSHIILQKQVELLEIVLALATDDTTNVYLG
jgi:hypothetical protein